MSWFKNEYETKIGFLRCKCDGELKEGELRVYPTGFTAVERLGSLYEVRLSQTEPFVYNFIGNNRYDYHQFVVTECTSAQLKTQTVAKPSQVSPT